MITFIRRILGIHERVENEPRPEHDREIEAARARIALLQREVELIVRDKDQ